ncbi:unnamed protein product [Prorocentrum cordatum]|uniref:Uncharacterized protein n=1 Tax=Prorocentrum cordatum TaxID=2364126 RepID=A0ABN9S2P0_9DINO|nr:unnamed protein product [Polarella glacialis]
MSAPLRGGGPSGLPGWRAPREGDLARGRPRDWCDSGSCGSWELVGTSWASFGRTAGLTSSASSEIDGASSLESDEGLASAGAPREQAALDEVAAASECAPLVGWCPRGSMELDAVVSQEAAVRARAAASACSSGASTPGRRGPCAGGASLPDVAMSLESFLEEEVPAFPFSNGAKDT